MEFKVEEFFDFILLRLERDEKLVMDHEIDLVDGVENENY
jgi:hypothetical protein